MRIEDAVELPVSSTPWEVMLVDAPVVIASERLDAMMVVVEQASGLVRSVGPVIAGRPLWDVFSRAFEPEVAMAPARPSRLLCVDPDLAEQLRAELRALDVAVDVVAELPGAEHAANKLTEAIMGVPAPGIRVALGSWARALQLLATREPWRSLPDNVEFRFDHPAHAGRVAVFTGQVDPQVGFEVHVEVEEGRHWAIYLEPADAFSPEEQSACRHAGLDLPGGRMPRVLGMEKGFARPLNEAEERALLGALEATLTLLAAHPSPASGASHRAFTSIGPVQVSATIGFEPILPGEFTIDFGAGPPDGPKYAMMLQSDRRQAERLERVLSNVSHLTVEPFGPAGADLLAHRGAETLGVVISMQDATMFRAIEAAGALAVLISGAGTERDWDERKVFAILELPVGANPAAVAPPPVGKVVDVLQDYARAGFGGFETLPQSAAFGVIEGAATVWNAVVIADFKGDDSVLRDILEFARSGGPDSVRRMQYAIDVKRQEFGADARMIINVRIEGKGKKRRLCADATVLK